MYNTTGFFLFGWACHYLPFFTMSRQTCVASCALRLSILKPDTQLLASLPARASSFCPHYRLRLQLYRNRDRQLPCLGSRTADATSTAAARRCDDRNEDRRSGRYTGDDRWLRFHRPADVWCTGLERRCGTAKEGIEYLDSTLCVRFLGRSSCCVTVVVDFDAQEVRGEQ